MKTRKMGLVFASLTLLALLATACNKGDISANANAGSKAATTSSPSPATSSTVSKRFVGTWVEEDNKSDKGTRFTEDGTIIELSGNKEVGTFTTTGDDKASIKMTEGGTANASLESDTRMKMIVGTETAYLTKK